MCRILIVEDDRNTRLGLGEILSGEGFRVRLAADAEQALALGLHGTDVLLSDLRLPGKSGLDLAELVKKAYPEVAVIIMTAYSTSDTCLDGKNVGVDVWLTKPLDIERLIDLLKGLSGDSGEGRSRVATHGVTAVG